MSSGVVNRLLRLIWENEETGENEKTSEDDKALDNEVKKFTWVPGELKSVLGLG
jgi:hypothetical protein